MKSCPMACFRCNTAENFILSLKYRQRKGDLNANKKSLVFVIIRHRKFHFYVELLYTKISDLRKNTHLQKDAAFLHFRFEGKFRKYDVSVKRKRTKADKKNDLFCPFHKFSYDENSSFHAVQAILKEDYQKPSKKLILFFLLNPVSFSGQSYQKQTGSRTSDQSFLWLQKKLKNITLFVIYYLTNFDNIM